MGFPLKLKEDVFNFPLLKLSGVGVRSRTVRLLFLVVRRMFIFADNVPSGLSAWLLLDKGAEASSPSPTLQNHTFYG